LLGDVGDPVHLLQPTESAQSLRESCLSEVSAGELAAQKVRRVVEIRAREIGVAQRRTFQTCLVQFATAEIDRGQVRVLEVGPSQVGALKLRSSQIASTEIRPCEVCARTLFTLGFEPELVSRANRGDLIVSESATIV